MEKNPTSARELGTQVLTDSINIGVSTLMQIGLEDLSPEQVLSMYTLLKVTEERSNNRLVELRDRLGQFAQERGSLNKAQNMRLKIGSGSVSYEDKPKMAFDLAKVRKWAEANNVLDTVFPVTRKFDKASLNKLQTSGFLSDDDMAEFMYEDGRKRVVRPIAFPELKSALKAELIRLLD